MPSADQVPVKSPHSTMHWHLWVVLIAGSTGSALRAVRPPNLHITPDVGAISVTPQVRRVAPRETKRTIAAETPRFADRPSAHVCPVSYFRHNERAPRTINSPARFPYSTGDRAGFSGSGNNVAAGSLSLPRAPPICACSASFSQQSSKVRQLASISGELANLARRAQSAA